MNSLNFSQFENYHLQRLNQAANIDSNAVIEVDRRSILSSRMRRQVDPNSYNIWPLQLNIPQLAEGPGNPSIMRQVISWKRSGVGMNLNFVGIQNILFYRY